MTLPPEPQPQKAVRQPITEEEFFDELNKVAVPRLWNLPGGYWSTLKTTV